MPLSPNLIGPMLEATREAAAAFHEDLQYIRATLAEEATGSKIRRLSAILRRLLVEQDLRTISAPRLNRKVHLTAPDNSPFYHAERDIGAPLLFFGTTPSRIFGDGSGYMCAMAVPSLARGMRRIKKLAPPEGKREFIKLPFDNFMNQRVICAHNEWVNRRECIKFIANMASGVHSGPPKEPQEKLLSEISRTNAFTFNERGGLAIQLFNMGINNRNPPFTYNPDAINPVMVELLCAARFLESSPDIIELDEIIKNELRPPPASSCAD